MRVAASFLALLLLSPLPARAGDAATLGIVGFSDDGGIFAFEEFGVQDGSGFPYANRFYIDTGTDAFLPGTPIRVRLDDETASVETARQEARRLGQSVVAEETLTRNPGYAAGVNALTELSADPLRMVVNPRPIFHPVDPALEFRLELVPLAPPPNCDSHGEIFGFRLLQIDARDGGKTMVLHEDTRIPSSRNCPNGYSIGQVQTFFEGGLPAFAVLIAIRSYGFEGPDFRWLAVTGRL